MKIEIKFNESSINLNALKCDWAETARAYTDSVKYLCELEFPDAEVEVIEGEYAGQGITVLNCGDLREEDVSSEVHRICEEVYEAGNFWS